MDDTPVFIVTTLEKLEKEIDHAEWLETGCISTVGFFHELAEAQRAVIDNMCDINETVYDYAIIEEMPVGFYPYSTNSWFYKYNYKKDEYEAIEKPAIVPKHYVFSLR